MSQQDASATRPYRGLVLDTRALAVFKLGCTILILIEPAEQNSLQRRIADAEAATREIRCSIAGDMFVLQQDNAPAHRARDTVELLRSKTPQFISSDMWPANSPDLNPVDYRVCMGHAARAHISSTNRYRRVAEMPCCDMG